MDLVIVGKLVAIVFLIIGNAFFVGSEIAITSARRSRIKQLADMGNKSAKTVQLLHNEPTRFYSVTQIGITLVSMALGAIGMTTVAALVDPMFERLFSLFGDSEAIYDMAHLFSYILAFCVISFLHVVAGELAPKVLAFHKAEQMSMALGGIVNFLYRAWRPVIWVMNHASNGLLWICGQGDIIGGGDGHGSAAMSEEELQTVMVASEQAGHISPDVSRIVRGAFNLGGDKVRAVMVPRVNVQALHEDDTFLTALELFKKTNHKRFPVHSGSLENIVGVVSIKTMLHALESNTDKAAKVLDKPVKEFMLEPFMVPVTSDVRDLLGQFKQKRRQIAIVVNEYGGMAGVVTLEDILSDLIGEVQDEYAAHSRKVREVEPGRFDIDASMRVSDLEPVTNFPFPLDPGYTTLGGLLYSELGKIPLVDDTVDLGGGRLKVLEMEGHRIARIEFLDTEIDEDGKERPAAVAAAAA